jgi:glycosyltransferase involved in cell wall biosynthesis
VSTASDAIQLSVLIPAFNEEKLLGRCLASVAEASTAWRERGWRHEVIVCDNNSTDATADIARAHGALVVAEPVNQIGRARNRAAAAARGRWLLFLDADSFPTTGLFAELADALAAGDCVGGGANVELENYAGRGRHLAALWNRLSRWTGWAPGGFIFCEAAAFRRLGGFSLDLYVSEEIEFSRRLKRLARAHGRRVVILRRHRLLTSPRKLSLYSPAEFRRFVLRSVFSAGHTHRRREDCAIWYDGRR